MWCCHQRRMPSRPSQVRRRAARLGVLLPLPPAVAAQRPGQLCLLLPAHTCGCQGARQAPSLPQAEAGKQQTSERRAGMTFTSSGAPGCWQGGALLGAAGLSSVDACRGRCRRTRSLLLATRCSCACRSRVLQCTCDCMTAMQWGRDLGHGCSLCTHPPPLLLPAPPQVCAAEGADAAARREADVPSAAETNARPLAPHKGVPSRGSSAASSHSLQRQCASHARAAQLCNAQRSFGTCCSAALVARLSARVQSGVPAFACCRRMRLHSSVYEPLLTTAGWRKLLAMPGSAPRTCA